MEREVECLHVAKGCSGGTGDLPGGDRLRNEEVHWEVYSPREGHCDWLSVSLTGRKNNTLTKRKRSNI